MKLALVVVGILSAAAKITHADCAMVRFTPHALTPASANVGPHGGVVVAQLAFTPGPEHGAGAAWKYRNGAHLDAPTVTNLAPGLDVYVPKVRGVKVVLEDGVHAAVVEVAAAGGALPVLAAPALQSAGFTESRGRHSGATGWVELAGDPPDGAIALVAFDKAGKARSFGAVVKNAKQVTIYMASDCGGPFDGTVASRSGDTITVAWVDASGALSKPSAPIKVK